MANEAAPRIPIELDKPRTLLFDFNALAAFEEATGEKVLSAGLSIDSAKNLRAFLWAGLLHEDADLTLEDVGRMIHVGNTAAIAERLTAGLGVAMPENNPEGNGAAVKSRKAG